MELICYSQVSEHSKRDNTLLGKPRTAILYDLDNSGKRPKDSLRILTDSHAIYREFLRKPRPGSRVEGHRHHLRPDRRPPGRGGGRARPQELLQPHARGVSEDADEEEVGDEGGPHLHHLHHRVLQDEEELLAGVLEWSAAAAWHKTARTVSSARTRSTGKPA